MDNLDLSDAGGSPEVPRIQFSIAEINLVGSEWKELGTFDTAGVPFDTTVTVAQINTHENVEYAATLSQIGVEGEIDQVTGVRAREQSLVLVATKLDTGTSGLAGKSLFRGENYIHYDRIKMFVYGDPNVTSHIPMDSTGDRKSVV